MPVILLRIRAHRAKHRASSGKYTVKERYIRREVSDEYIVKNNVPPERIVG